MRIIAIGLVILTAVAATAVSEEKRVKTDEYTDFNYGQPAGNDDWVQSIKVTSPACRSDVKGDTRIEFIAPGMKFAKELLASADPRTHQRMGSRRSPGGHATRRRRQGLFRLQG